MNYKSENPVKIGDVPLKIHGATVSVYQEVNHLKYFKLHNLRKNLKMYKRNMLGHPTYNQYIEILYYTLIVKVFSMLL